MSWVESNECGEQVFGKCTAINVDIGKDCAEKLIKEIKTNSGIDQYSTDQILPFMILNKKNSIVSSKITKHTLSGIYVIEEFLDIKFKVEGNRISIE